MAETARAHRDLFGSLLGVAVFLGGVVLMVVVFRLAYGMFTTSPHAALGLQQGKPLDINTVGPNFAGIIIRILLLLVMGVTGSLVANRGIALYTASRALHIKQEPVKTES